MPDGSAQTEISDALLASVQRQVTEIAWGNPFRMEGFSFAGTREDRLVGLTMRVDVTSKEAGQTLRGQAEPPGHTKCRDDEAAARFLAAAFTKSATSPDTLGKLTSRLRSDPVQAFAETQDNFEIGVVAGQCHVHGSCRDCGQTGFVDCGGCGGSGRVRCFSCHDGMRQCTGCNHGTVYYTEQVWNPATNGYWEANRSRLCTHCGGRGRVDSCGTCHGHMEVRCTGCGGRGDVGCATCGRTGWITVATTLRLVGKPVRSTVFDADAPAEFRKGVAALPVTDLPGQHGRVIRELVETVGGKVRLTLDCMLPHIRLEARFSPDIAQRFDAVGLLGRIAVMPVFLDRMLAPLSEELRRAAGGKRLQDALRLAKETRVTCSALVAVSGREGHGLEMLRHIWKGAASDEILSGFLDDLRSAYDGVGASAVRRPWQLLALPVIAAAAAAFPFHVALPVLNRLSFERSSMPLLESVLDVAIGLLPFGLAYMFAGRQARRAVRTLVGKDAARVPRQGWWARGVAIAAVAALIAGAVEGGGPRPLFALPVTASHLLPAFHPQGGGGAVRMSLLSPTTLPKLRPVFLVDRTRGAPDIFWLQLHLRQLGFLHADPDGIVHPSTYDALNMFNNTLPRSRKRFRPGWDAAATAAAALRGEFPLERLAADIFPMPGLSNMARANLTGRDAVVLQATASRAIAAPGQEASWRDDNGTSGGRLIATSMPDGCPLLQVEVEIRGAVESAGPFPYCRGRRR